MSDRQEDLDLARRAREIAEFADLERTTDWLAMWLPAIHSKHQPGTEADRLRSLLGGLVGARTLALAAVEIEKRYAAELREHEVSWTAIGIAADMTRQSAQQRYGSL